MPGVQFNREGVVVIDAHSQLLWDSMVSAHSGRTVVPGGVLEPVPGTEGLFVRLTPGESRQLDPAARERAYAKARTWYQTVSAALILTGRTASDKLPPDDASSDDDDGSTRLDDLTVTQLRRLARVAGIAGVKSLTRAQLVAALTVHPDPIPAAGAADSLDEEPEEIPGEDEDQP